MTIFEILTNLAAAGFTKSDIMSLIDAPAQPIQPIQQPMPQPMPQPIQQPMPQPMPQPIQQPMPQPMPQPIQQPMPQPVQYLNQQNMSADAEALMQAMRRMNTSIDIPPAQTYEDHLADHFKTLMLGEGGADHGQNSAAAQGGNAGS